MRTLPVRLLDLATALQDHDRESTTYYFDSQSGEIVFLTEDGRGSDRRWDIISSISWCNGFMLGADHYKPAWESWFKDARRTKAISLIEGMSAPENALDDETAWVNITRISELVPLIHAYWTFESALDGYLADRE